MSSAKGKTHEITENSNCVPFSQVSLTYSQNTSLQKSVPAVLLKAEGGKKPDQRKMSEFSTQQRTGHESGKTSSLDDFFNLNQPSDARQELFDNYDMFYKEQAQLESSFRPLSPNMSIEKSIITEIGADEP